MTLGVRVLDIVVAMMMVMVSQSDAVVFKISNNRLQLRLSLLVTLSVISSVLIFSVLSFLVTILHSPNDLHANLHISIILVERFRVKRTQVLYISYARLTCGIIMCLLIQYYNFQH